MKWSGWIVVLLQCLEDATAAEHNYPESIKDLFRQPDTNPLLNIPRPIMSPIAKFVPITQKLDQPVYESPFHGNDKPSLRAPRYRSSWFLRDDFQLPSVVDLKESIQASLQRYRKVLQEKGQTSLLQRLEAQVSDARKYRINSVSWFGTELERDAFKALSVMNTTLFQMWAENEEYSRELEELQERGVEIARRLPHYAAEFDLEGGGYGQLLLMMICDYYNRENAQAELGDGQAFYEYSKKRRERASLYCSLADMSPNEEKKYFATLQRHIDKAEARTKVEAKGKGGTFGKKAKIETKDKMKKSRVNAKSTTKRGKADTRSSERGRLQVPGKEGRNKEQELVIDM